MMLSLLNIDAFNHPLSRFLLQLLVILIATRAAGWVLRKFGQPAVIGEIGAGIILGPSLVGAYFPGFTTFLFPAASLGTLQLVSEVGLVLFMFVIGIELDAEVVRKKARQGVIISITSIVLPFALGLALSFYIDPKYIVPGASHSGFALFMGIAMSITAFPVLARILRERAMATTRLGALALTCAAADDVIAWCVLAVVTAIIKAGSLNDAWITIGLAVVYVLIMLLLVKPALHKRLVERPVGEGMPRYMIPVALGGMLLSAWLTQVIGIHALFGAFLAGLVVPVDWAYRKAFIARIEDVAQVLLLPVFFMITGLRTQIGLLGNAGAIVTCLLIIFAAVAGKLGGTLMAARFTGESWRDSIALGALMNTRGLMQLIVLNIGHDLGILSDEMFAMMIIMALVTTMMTGPILNRVMAKS